MAFDLVIDIGNSRVKAALFDGSKTVDAFAAPVDSLGAEEWERRLKNASIARCIISSVNSKAEAPLFACLEKMNIPYQLIDYLKIKLILDVDEPEQLGHDRIANAYGALTHFPLNDCIVIDIGTAITADYVAKEGRYAGGMIYPGATLCAKALAQYTDKLPEVSPAKTDSALGKTTETHIQSGIYWGQLGAIERMIAELKMTSAAPAAVKVLATGGPTRDAELAQDLSELVDLIDPQLTLLGLLEIAEKKE
ncbi:MAG: type III pantothenate kinase [Chlamydiota bacterium]